ncbi:hypothetical protein FE257_004301 [Aspergillus nanangensis]|uniref:Transketolase-like pyrimidine-binding domain-containing protein n=1 Tax=Aspergillus nanangensis TaxID=2582783 RepID=A0AAD4GN32_ASPNN|nr:hypothetical protein FE257_004301 [Aspergillus nanangensis]
MKRMAGSFGDWAATLNGLDSTKFQGMATRESNGENLDILWASNPALCGGGADLVGSNKFKYAVNDVFHPLHEFKGRYIRHGIQEHAMAAVANGLAAFHPGTFIPVTATFFMFYLYAAPAVRMGALSHLQVIHIATHDSFQEGQNGPTHQPVELDSLFRAMPNLIYMRPCDAEELIGAYQHALSNRCSPMMLSIARDPVGYVPSTNRTVVARGAYVIQERSGANVTLISCGSQLHYVVAAADGLKKRGITCRVVSAPCLDLFATQSADYRESVLPSGRAPIVSVEEYAPMAWARYVNASIGMSGYGYSASKESNYARFGLDPEAIVGKVMKYLNVLDGEDARRMPWRLL